MAAPRGRASEFGHKAPGVSNLHQRFHFFVIFLIKAKLITSIEEKQKYLVSSGTSHDTQAKHLVENRIYVTCYELLLFSLFCNSYFSDELLLYKKMQPFHCNEAFWAFLSQLTDLTGNPVCQPIHFFHPGPPKLR